MSTVRNRAKDQLPQVLLTLMSIIQALALEFLWDDVRVAERALRWDAVSTWLQIVADMLGIVQVWLIYTSATMRVRWTPSMRVNFQEFDQVLTQPVIVGMLHHRLALARPGKRHFQNIAHLGFGAVGHAHDAIGQK